MTGRGGPPVCGSAQRLKVTQTDRPTALFRPLWPSRRPACTLCLFGVQTPTCEHVCARARPDLFRAPSSSWSVSKSRRPSGFPGSAPADSRFGCPLTPPHPALPCTWVRSPGLTVTTRTVFDESACRLHVVAAESVFIQGP